MPAMQRGDFKKEVLCSGRVRIIPSAPDTLCAEVISVHVDPEDQRLGFHEQSVPSVMERLREQVRLKQKGGMPL